MIQSIHLRDVGPAREMHLDLASRLNMLTGDNGLGKSFLLDIAWWLLTRDWAGSPAWPDPERATNPKIEATFKPGTLLGGPKKSFVYDFKTQRWRLGQPGIVGAQVPDAGIVLYARPDGSVSIFDFLKTASQPRPGEDANHVWAVHLGPKQVWEGLRDNGGWLCNGLYRDWITWQDRSSREFAILKSVLAQLSPSRDEVLVPGRPKRIEVGKTEEIPTLVMPYGHEVPVKFVSAGMQRILGLAYGLIWAWSERQTVLKLRKSQGEARMTLLVDEIEAHLHPQWQRSILPSLMDAALSLDGVDDLQILVNTHSPLVLASAEPTFDPDRDALFHLDMEKGKVSLEKTEWQARGDVSSWLTSEVFELGEARSLPAEEAIESAREAFRNPDITTAELRDIHRRLRAVLKDTDPFWVRWVAQAEAVGIEP